MPYIEGSTDDVLLYAGTPSNGTNEVQLLTYTATTGTNDPVSGTFIINYEGQRTSALAFNASAADVQTALRAIATIGTAGCSVTVAAGPPRVYTVTFDGGNMQKLALPLMTVESNTMVDVGGHVVTPVPSESVAGVTATYRGAAPGRMLLDTTNGVPYWNAGTALAPSWTTIAATTASTAELNLIDGSVAGTAVASKAAVLGANKNLDEFHTAALSLGAGAGTLVSSTAAEINTLAGVTAGTVTASKALVVDANKDIATLRNVTASGTVQGAAVTATGALTGATVAAKDTVAAVTLDGAVAVPSVNTDFVITKAGVCAMTLVDPTNVTHDGLIVRFVAATAHAHTLDNSAGSGINSGGAGSDIGTFGGAIGDNIVLLAYGGKWIKISSVNVTLA